MHCSRGEGTPACADRVPCGGGVPTGGREVGLADIERLAGQAAWRDWGRDLPGDPQERAGIAEVEPAEVLAALGALESPGPGCLTDEGRRLVGQAAACFVKSN